LPSNSTVYYILGTKLLKTKTVGFLPSTNLLSVNSGDSKVLDGINLMHISPSCMNSTRILAVDSVTIPITGPNVID